MQDMNSLVSLWTKGWEKSDPVWLPKFAGFFGAGGILLFGAVAIYRWEHDILKAAIAGLVALFLIATPLVGIRKARDRH